MEFDGIDTQAILDAPRIDCIPRMRWSITVWPFDFVFFFLVLIGRQGLPLAKF